MPKTNKEIRSNLADKYNNELKKVKSTLKSLAELGYSDEEIQATKEKLISTLQDRLEKEEGYQESKKTHLDEKQAKKRLKKAKKEYEDAEKLYEEAQITHRGKVEEGMAKNGKGMSENDSENSGEGNSENGGEGVVENGEIPQSLKDFREKWKKEIDLSDDKKKAIIDAVNKIPHRATIESDGSRLVEFELGGGTFQCLDVNLAKHSDADDLKSYNYNWQTNNEVELGGMRGNDTSKRRNRTLEEYVEKEKKDREMDIPTVGSQRYLINKLGEVAGLTEMEDKIAMWMYLTGNYGYYWLTMGDGQSSKSQDSRSILSCNDNYRWFHYGYTDDFHASLCLIA